MIAGSTQVAMCETSPRIFPSQMTMTLSQRAFAARRSDALARVVTARRRAVPSPCSPSGAGSCRFACSLVLCLASGRAHWGPRVHDNFLAHAHPRSRA